MDLPKVCSKTTIRNASKFDFAASYSDREFETYGLNTNDLNQTIDEVEFKTIPVPENISDLVKDNQKKRVAEGTYLGQTIGGIPHNVGKLFFKKGARTGGI